MGKNLWIMTVGNMNGALRERLVSELQLTAVQRSRLDEILAASRPGFAAVRELPEEQRAALVRHGETLCRRREDGERLVERAPSHPPLTAELEILGEAPSLEPLEHHVRSDRARRDLHPAEVDRPHDVERRLREGVEELRLLLEAAEQ